jgi:hypothetical protein
MYYGLNNSQFLRLSEDVVPEQSIFVYRYLADHLLSFVRKELSVPVTKRILKDTLRGLAALHEQNIVHTGKPRNHPQSVGSSRRRLMRFRHQTQQYSSRLGK